MRDQRGVKGTAVLFSGRNLANCDFFMRQQQLLTVLQDKYTKKGQELRSETE